jgi:uncharacterized Zn finger protein
MPGPDPSTPQETERRGELTTRCENCGEVIDVESIFGSDRDEFVDVSDCPLCMDDEELPDA